jgi:putative sigma-54 modulation protein
MRLRIKGRHVELSQSVRDYAEAKLQKLDKQLAEPTQVELELWEEHNPSIAAHHVAEATIWTKGPILRAREASADHRASIDQLVDKLERQVKRYRDKRRSRRDRQLPEAGIPEEAIPIDEEPRIVKSKQFAVKPMGPEEAVLQLELVGHDFFVFQNADTGDVNVVYRRRDGAYGLIEPQI